MKYVRPPRGVFSERTLALTKEMGYYNVFWSLAFLDWKVDQQRGWQYAHNNVMTMIHPGSILLLHAISKDNAEALAKIIDDLREKGYHFKSLDDLVKAINRKHVCLRFSHAIMMCKRMGKRMWSEHVTLEYPYHFEEVLKRLSFDPLNVIQLDEKVIYVPLCIDEEQIVVRLQGIGTVQNPQFWISSQTGDQRKS